MNHALLRYELVSFRCCMDPWIPNKILPPTSNRPAGPARRVPEGVVDPLCITI